MSVTKWLIEKLMENAAAEMENNAYTTTGSRDKLQFLHGGKGEKPRNIANRITRRSLQSRSGETVNKRQLLAAQRESNLYDVCRADNTPIGNW